MADELPIPPDIIAMCDVVAELAGEAEHFDKERCVATRDGIVQLQARLKDLSAVVDTVLMAQIEQPFQYRDKVFFRKLGAKAEANHVKIRRRVAEIAAAPDDDGVIPTALEAAKAAAQAMYDLYVTKAKVPSKRGFDDVGLEQSQFVEWKDDPSEHLEITDLRRPG